MNALERLILHSFAQDRLHDSLVQLCWRLNLELELQYKSTFYVYLLP